MAKSSKASFASSKQTSTKWLKNALRSVGVSTGTALKEYMPNMYDAVSTGANASRNVVQNLRKTVAGNNQVAMQLQKNKYVRFAQTAYKNAISDLRTGNLNNQDRGLDAFGGDDSSDNFNFDDSGFSFSDDGADVNVVVNQNSGSNDAMLVMSESMNKQTEAHLKTSQASMNAMIAVHSASMTQIQQIGSQVVSELDSINKNISSLLDYQNNNMTRFIEASVAFYERMGSKVDNGDEGSNNKEQKISANQVFNSNTGGINLATYRQYVTQQMKGAFDNSSIGMITSMLDENTLMMAASNPLGFATDFAVKAMMPKIVSTTLQGVEETFSAAIPSLLHKLADWGDEYATDMRGKVKQFIGRSFGLRIKRDNDIKKGATIDKGPVPFDGITRHAITEIITKELREQTAYLKAIAGHYKIDTDQARKDSEVFDYRSKSYIKQSDVTGKILQEIRDATIAQMNNGLFGKELRKSVKGLDDEKNQQALSSMIDELMIRLEKHGKAVGLGIEDFRDRDSAYNTIMRDLSGPRDLKRYLRRYIQTMARNNPDAANDLSRAILSANASRNAAVKNIRENPVDYNLWAASDLDHNDLDDLMLQYMQGKYNGASMKREPSREGARPSSFREFMQQIENRENGESEESGNRRRRRRSTTTIENPNAPRARIGRGQINRMIQKASESGQQTPSQVLSGELNNEDSLLSNLIGRAGKGAQNILRSLGTGNFNEVMSSITDTVIDQAKSVYAAFNENFLTPIKNSFFGTKDEDGFSRDGIFSGVQNGFKDAVGMLRWHITGKSFKDSSGNLHEDKQEGDSVVGHLKNMASSIKAGIMEKLFGKQNEEGEEQAGILSKFTDSIREGLVGWQEALFGKELDEEERANLKDSMIKNLNERLPATLTGGAVGAGVGMMSGGSLLGMLVGGPIGGAAFGAAIGFASRSEKFQNWLFGEKDEDGNRTGGFISKGVQDFFSENKNYLIGGAALGALKGTITGGGVLGTLVGGPIGGALMGTATSIVLRSKMFQEFLYGNEETGQKGVIASLKSVFSRAARLNGEGEGLSGGGKALGMGLLGAGGGALTAAVVGKMGILGAALTPFGPIGGALVGLGLGIRAQKDNFHKWLFGEKDEEGNQTSVGILGQFKNMLDVSVLRPLKSSMANFIDDAKFTLTYKILDPIRYAVEPIGDALVDFGTNIKNGITGFFNRVGNTIGDVLINPIVEKVDTLIISPIKGVVSGVTKAAWGLTKNIVTFPFRMLDHVTKILTSPIRKAFKFVQTNILDPVRDAVHDYIIDPIKNVFKKIFGGIGKAVKFAITTPLNFIGGSLNYLGDRLAGVGGADREHTNVGGILEDQRDQRRARREQMRVDRFNMRKNKRERSIRNANEQAIARATNYQFVEDTEENRKRAEAAGLRRNWRIDAAEDKSKKAQEGDGTTGLSDNDILSANPANLSEEGRQTNILLRILDYLKGTGLNRHVRSESSDHSPDISHGEPNDVVDQTRRILNDDNDTTPDSPRVLSGSEKVASDIANAGGILAYTGGKIKGGFNALLNRFTGKGYAEGTDNAEEGVSVVGEEGPELVNFNGGEQVLSNRKPIAVYVTGMSQGVGSLISRVAGKFGFGRSTKNEPDGVNSDSTDIRATAMRAASVGGVHSSGSDSLAMSIVGGAVGGTNRDENNQEAYEDDIAAVASNLDAKSRLEDAIDKGYTAEERQAKLKEEEHEKKMDAIVENTSAQVEEQKGFGDLWSSIFSKKGLITGALALGLPFILKFFKNTLPGVINGVFSFLSNIASALGFTLDNAAESATFVNENGGLGDSKSTGDKITENVNRITNLFKLDLPGFVLNEDGEWDHESGANTKGLTQLVAKAVAGGVGLNNAGSLIDVLKMGPKGLVQSGSKSLIDNGTKKMTNAVTGSNWYQKLVEKVTGKSADEAAEAVVSSGGGAEIANVSDDMLGNFLKDFSDEGAETVTTTILKQESDDMAGAVAKGSLKSTIATAAKSAGETVLTKTGDIIKIVGENIIKFADDVVAKVASTVGVDVGSAVVRGLVDDVIRVVTEKSAVIAAKVAPILEFTTGLAATGVGLLAQQTTWITLGALNGLTGAARLFRVDSEYVDTVMIAISAAMGAFTGSLPGSIADVVNEVVCSVTGVDFFCELATFIYNAIAGKDKAKELREGRENFEQAYLDYQEKTLTEQYKTAVAAGLVDEHSLTLENYIAGVRSGDIKADYDSFADFNDNQHMTAGSHVWKGIVGIAKRAGKGIDSVGKAIFGGSTTEYKVDNNGNTYTDNGDGTWSVKTADGIDIGYLSEDAIPEDAQDVTKETKGLVHHVGEAASNFGAKVAQTASAVGTGVSNTVGFEVDRMKSFYLGGSRDAFYAADGSYYLSNGEHYNANGEYLETVFPQQVEAMYLMGQLTKGEPVEMDSDIARGFKVIKDGAVSTWNIFKTNAINTGTKIADNIKTKWDNTVNFVKTTAGVAQWLFTKDFETVYNSPDGSYYDGTGVHYNAMGDKIGGDLDPETLVALIDNGTLTQDERVDRDYGFKTVIDETRKKVVEGWNTFSTNAKETAQTVWEGAKERGKQLYEFVNGKLIDGYDFFIGNSDEAWYDSDGGYYMANGDNFNYYSANGDLLDESIDGHKVKSLIRSGMLSLGYIKHKSGLQTKIEEVGEYIKTSVSTTWDNVKSTAHSIFEGAKERGKQLYEFVNGKLIDGYDFFIGNSDEAWYDSDGGYYMANGDNFNYYNGDGELLAENVDGHKIKSLIRSGMLSLGYIKHKSGLQTKIEEVGGYIQTNVVSAWNGIKSTAEAAFDGVKARLDAAEGFVRNKVEIISDFFIAKDKEAWYDSDGGYYMINGGSFDYYNSNGDLVSEGIGRGQVMGMITEGLLTKGTARKESGISTLVMGAIDHVHSTFTSTVEKGKAFITRAFESALDIHATIEKNGGIFGTISKSFSKKTSDVWIDTGGGYYKLVGSTYNYYNANGDLISEGISAKTIGEMSANNLIHRGSVKENSEAENAIKKIRTSIADAWKNAGNVVSNAWNKFTNWITGSTNDAGIETGGAGLGKQSKRGPIVGIPEVSAFVSTVRSIPDSDDDGGYGYGGKLHGHRVRSGGRGPQTYRGVYGSKYYKTGGGGRRKFRGGRGGTYYSQNDTEWANDAYGYDGATMADTGCGPTAMAMVASSMSGSDVTPPDMARFAETIGARDDTGTNANFIPAAAGAYGLSSVQTANPSSEYLYDAASRGPSVLLGSSGNGSGHPYTPAGHYIVTDGVDGSGNIRVKDPRGSSYNRTYPADELADSTEMSWNFGGSGPRVREVTRRMIHNLGKVGGNFVRNLGGFGKKGSANQNWINTVKAVKRAVAEKKPEYNKSKHIKIKLNGKSLSMRTDCSGFVSACLRFYGVLKEELASSTMKKGGAMDKTGFKYKSWPGWNSLVEGDILVSPGSHTEIFSHNKKENGKTVHYVYNGGSTEAFREPGVTRSGHSSYSFIWRAPDSSSSNSKSSNTESSGKKGVDNFALAKAWVDKVYKRIYDCKCRHGDTSHTYEEILKKRRITCTGSASIVFQQAGIIPRGKIVSHTKAYKYGRSSDSFEKALKKSVVNDKYLIAGTCDIVKVMRKFKNMPAWLQQKGIFYIQKSNGCVSAGGGKIYSCNHTWENKAHTKHGIYGKGHKNPLTRGGYPHKSPILFAFVPRSYGKTNVPENCGFPWKPATGKGKGTAVNTSGVTTITGGDTFDTTTETTNGGTTNTTGATIPASTSILDKITGFMGEMSNRAIEGAFTGNYDTDYTSYWAGVENQGINIPDAGTTDNSNSSDTSNDTDDGADIDTEYATTKDLKGSSNEKKIWNYLTTNGKFTDAQAAGIMGNLYAESALRPNNLEQTYEKSLGYTDKSYTKAVDSGKYSAKKFAHDSAGYGLAQWTYWTRKKKLLEFAKKSKTSIADMGMQLNYLMKELNHGEGKLGKKIRKIKNSGEEGVGKASNIMLYKFENPNNASGKEKKRKRYSMGYYKRNHGKGGRGVGITNTPSLIMDGFVNGHIPDESYDVVITGGSGPRKPTIRPKYVSGNSNKPIISQPSTVRSLNISPNVLDGYDTTNAYISATRATNYITTTDSGNLDKAFDRIIELLESITGNTATTSDKLDYLKNMRQGNTGGNTILVNSSNTQPSVNVSSGGINNSSNSSTSVSRNRLLAQRIAIGS